MAAGAVLGGIAGALVGRAKAGDCANEGCVGYESLHELDEALQGAAVGLPIGALAGYVVARLTARPR